MKRKSGWLWLGLVAFLLCGFGEKPVYVADVKTVKGVALVDFEDGSPADDPNWFIVGNVAATIVKNSYFPTKDAALAAELGKYSVQLRGSATNWYVGGVGLLTQLDVRAYDYIELCLFGFGANSGKLRVELYDDDNGSGEIEASPDGALLYDDLYVATVPIDWQGWHKVVIPIAGFVREGHGNGIFDPGLVRIQLLFYAVTESGNIKLNLDSLKFSSRQ